MYGLSAFLERCLDELGVGRRKLVVHDWGALALIGAQRRPELVEKLVVDQRGAAAARLPLALGRPDLAPPRRSASSLNATTTRSVAGPDHAPGARRPQPDAAGVRRHDLETVGKGTSHAILTLYRHADPDRLAEAGKDLDRLTCPSLVLWGERDPYLSTKFAQAFADALPDSEMVLIPGAGHWPWIDDARVIDRVVDFVA